MRDILPDLGKIKLGIQVNNLTALICALIDHNGGAVTLSREEAERVWENPEIQFNKCPADNSLTLSLAGIPSKPSGEKIPDEEIPDENPDQLTLPVDGEV